MYETYDWIKCTVTLPKEGETVMTKILDANGERNEQKLIRKGNLWFLEDNSMYVYYTPTHWKSVYE